MHKNHLKTQIIREQIIHRHWNSNAFIFLPDEATAPKPTFGVFTHGYTSHKDSILTWPTRLAEEGIASVIFDLPGHYLGSFNDVDNFEEFKLHSHELQGVAFKLLQRYFSQKFASYDHFFKSPETMVIIAGHSLGGLLSLLAAKDENFAPFERLIVGVGLGMAPENSVHLFDTPFYKSTLTIRSQLVSPALSPENVFPWIKEIKNNIKMSDEKIFLLVGEDDLVVPRNGGEHLKKHLEAMGNTCDLETPRNLPHHVPELAASHIKSYLKKIGRF